jgi:DNA-binding NtrC family response regulator
MINRSLFTVLIIDDEPDILELMCEEFRYVGYNTISASSGNQAVSILSSDKKINLVVSDFKMPDGNGMVVLNHVSSMNPKPFFFFVSGQADISVEQAVKAGALKFFHKPFDLDELIKDIESTIVPLCHCEIYHKIFKP